MGEGKVIKKIILVAILVLGQVSVTQETNDYDVCPLELCFGIDCDKDL